MLTMLYYTLFGLALGLLALGFRRKLRQLFYRPLQNAFDRFEGLDSDCITMGFAGALAIFAITTFLGFPILLNLLLTTFTFLGVPFFIVQRRRELFRKNFDYSLVDALTTVSASLKAGLPLVEALENAARNSEAAFASVAENIVKNYRFGVPIERALDNARRMIGSQNANISFGAMIIATELGGNLPDILRRIVGTIRERQRVEGKLASLTAQGRTQAAILMGAPPAFGFIMYLWDPNRTRLLIETGTGQILLSIAVILEITGILITKKIMKLDI